MAVTTNAHTKGDKEKAEKQPSDKQTPTNTDTVSKAASDSSTDGAANKAHRDSAS